MNNVKLQKATFAGGCFWCMQPFFDRVKGVKETMVGYTGGHTANPTYEEVSNGQTGHAEVIEITYDPSIAIISIRPRSMRSSSITVRNTGQPSFIMMMNKNALPKNQRSS